MQVQAKPPMLPTLPISTSCIQAISYSVLSYSEAPILHLLEKLVACTVGIALLGFRVAFPIALWPARRGQRCHGLIIPGTLGTGLGQWLLKVGIFFERQ